MGQQALAGYLVENDGGGVGGVEGAGGAADGDADDQIAQVTPGAGQPGGLVADQEQGGPGEVGIEDVGAAVLVGAGQDHRAAAVALGRHPAGHLAVRGSADHGPREQRAGAGPDRPGIVDVGGVTGHDDAVRAEGVGRADDAADVARAGRAVQHHAEEVRPGPDPVQVVVWHPDHRDQFGRARFFLAEFGQQVGRHRDLEGGHVAQHGPRPGRQRALGVVEQRAERPAELGRQRDRAHALDQELPVPLALGPIAEQRFELLEPGVPRPDPEHLRQPWAASRSKRARSRARCATTSST